MPEPIIWLVGDPKAGGFKGVRYGATNNDLQPGESPDMYNYFTDDAGLVKRSGSLIDNYITEATNGTFARASTAYLPDGSPVLTGVARFYNSALLLEEGVANLVTSPLMTADANSDGTVDDFTFVPGTGNTAVSTLDSAQKIEITASTTTNLADVYQYIASINPGDVLSLSVTGKKTGNVTMKIFVHWYNNITYLSASAIVASTSTDYIRIKNENLTAPANTTRALLIIGISPNAIGDTGSGWFKWAQVAKKAYCTTMQLDGTSRAAESLTIPLAGIFTKSDWTISVDFTPYDTQIVAGKYGRVWSIAINANNYWQLLVHPNGRPYLDVTSGGVQVTTYNAADSVLAVGTSYRLVATGNGSTISLSINNVKSVAGNVSYTEPVGAIPANLYLGSSSSATSHANGYYDDLYFSEALIDVEITALGDYSTAIALVDSSLGYWSLATVVTGQVPVKKPCTGLFRYYDGVDNRTFKKCGTKVYRVPVSGNSTVLASGLTEGTEITFASGFGKYFFSDGSNVYSGTTSTASAMTMNDENGTALTGQVPNGKSIMAFKSKLWLTRDPLYPTRVYFSEVDFPDRYLSDGAGNVLGWVACDQDDGKAITGFVEDGDKVIAFKRHRYYLIIGDYIDSDHNYVQVENGPDLGAYDQKTIVKCADGFIRWFGPEGVFQLSTWNNNAPIHISSNIDYELNQISEANKTKCCAGYWNHYYILFYPFESATCNRALAYDTKRNEWFPIRSWSISYVIRFEDDSLHGGYSGNIGKAIKLFTGTTDEGAAIACYWESRAEGIPGTEQCLRTLRMVNVHSGQSVTVGWTGDTESGATGTWALSYNGIGYMWGDENDPESDDLQLGDETDPTDGGYYISEIEFMETSYNPVYYPANQRFREIAFTFSETSSEAHNVDYLEIKSVIIRKPR